MAVSAPEYRWLAVSARTGRVIADVPGLVCDQVGVILGGATTATAKLPLADRTPANWLQATAPVASCLVLLDGDTPVWGGIVLRRVRTADDTVDLTLSTWEWMLDGFYVGDATYSATEQTAIAADLVETFVLDGTHPLVVEATAGSTTRDRTYFDADDKTVLTVLGELMDVAGGPEWTITWRHLSDPERYVPVLTIAERIGSSPADGMGPAATFELPGPVTDVSFTEDWAHGAGATSVVATSNPDPNEVRPQSPPQTSDDPDRPTVQFRWSPSTSITDLDTLTEHAQARLDLMSAGSRAMALTARLEEAPRLGRTWVVGDDVGYRIQAPAFPGGLEGTARSLGCSLGLAAQTVTPILAAP